MSIIIQNGRLLDPASKSDRQADILIESGKIAQIADPGSLSTKTGDELIDAKDRWVMPGLVDIHVHLREPGQEYKEDIQSGSEAAAFGGVTTMVAMPNTTPAIDQGELVSYVVKRGREVGLCRVLSSGAVTQGQKGEMLAPFGEMKRAGAVALTDDGYPVKDAGLMRRALEYATDFGLTVMTHAEELSLTGCGSMHEGEVSTRLGLQGIPRVSEDTAVARDVMLCEYTGSKLHVCHVSTASAVQTIREAKARGVKVSGEAAPHHFTLTHEAVSDYATYAKMSPPLREEEDRLAVIEGLRDGTLEAIATDHAPHSSIEKEVAFDDAANGVLGLQTMLPLSLKLWRDYDFPVLDVVERLTWGPAKLLDLGVGQIKAGAVADLAVVDPEAEWVFSKNLVRSKSENSPFLDQKLKGRVEMTILEGQIVFRGSP